MNRRTFLGATAAVDATTRSILGAHDRVVIGLIGCGGRGRYVANFMRQAPNVDFAAADAYLPNAERAREVYADSKPEGKAPEKSHMTTTDATALHAAAFVDAVRTRKRPAADIEVGFRSTTVPLLGNIAYDTGRNLHWDAVKEEFTGDAEANKHLARVSPRKQWDWAR